MKKPNDYNKDYSEVQLREIFTGFEFSKDEVEKAIKRYFEIREQEVNHHLKLKDGLIRKNNMRDGEEIIYQIAEEIKKSRGILGIIKSF